MQYGYDIQTKPINRSEIGGSVSKNRLASDQNSPWTDDICIVVSF